MVGASQTLSGRAAEEKGRGSCGGKDPVCLAVPDCRYGREKLGRGSKEKPVGPVMGP